MIRSPLLLTFGLALLPACGSDPDSSPVERCNVLLITLDTVRADRLGCYGHEAAETPTFDRLASRGVLFDQAFTPVPITLPSHATMMTGALPPEHGVRANDELTLGTESDTLAELFQRRGYRTGAFVGAFVLDALFGLDRGFEHYDDRLSPEGATVQERSGDQVVDSALAWLAQPGDSPFFCWVHLYDPHAPYDPPAPYDERFPEVPYDGEIAFTDSQVARLTDWLESRGLTGETLVVVVSDHGESFGEHDQEGHGVFLYSTTMHVPLIFSLPGILAQDRRVEAMVGTADLFATLDDLFRLGADGPPESRSLASALLGEELDSRVQYGESNCPYYYYGLSPLRSLTTPEWKYVRAPQPELYDRLADPQELANLAGENPQLLESLEAELRALEEGLVQGAASRKELSAEQRRNLAALGYAAGGAGGELPVDYRSLEDPKDFIGVLNRWSAAMDLLHAGRAPEGLAAMEAVVVEHPGIAYLQSSLAAWLFQTGDFARASFYFPRALKAHEENRLPADLGKARMHAGYGLVLAKLNRHGEAVDQYRKALEIDPNSGQTLNNLATALARQGNFLEATVAYRGAVKLDPEHESYQRSLQQALQLLARSPRRYEEGVSLLERGVSYAAEDPTIMDVMARSLAACPNGALRDLDRADLLAEKICKGTRRQNPVFLDTLAIVHAGAGRFEQAQAVCNEALTIARQFNVAPLIAELQERMELYRAGRPYQL